MVPSSTKPLPSIWASTPTNSSGNSITKRNVQETAPPHMLHNLVSPITCIPTHLYQSHLYRANLYQSSFLPSSKNGLVKERCATVEVAPKRLVKRNVDEYWNDILVTESFSLDSLRYFDPGNSSLLQPHQIWTSSAGNSFECCKSTILARMISGRYRTEMMSQFWTAKNSGSLRARFAKVSCPAGCFFQLFLGKIPLQTGISTRYLLRKTLLW